MNIDLRLWAVRIRMQCRSKPLSSPGTGIPKFGGRCSGLGRRHSSPTTKSDSGSDSRFQRDRDGQRVVAFRAEVAKHGCGRRSPDQFAGKDREVPPKTRASFGNSG